MLSSEDKANGQQNNGHETTETASATTANPLGLLTTVEFLPAEYRKRYLSTESAAGAVKSEIPLDLSVKSNAGTEDEDEYEKEQEQGHEQGHELVNQTEIEIEHRSGDFQYFRTLEVTKLPTGKGHSYRFASNQASIDAADTAVADGQGHQTNAISHTMEEIPKKKIAASMTRKTITHHTQQQQLNSLTKGHGRSGIARVNVRKASGLSVKNKGKSKLEASNVSSGKEFAMNTEKCIKADDEHSNKMIKCTPAKPIRHAGNEMNPVKTLESELKTGKNKAIRKLKFDEETSSPVSGTIIRPLEEITEDSMQYSNGDIDPKYNIVEITQQTRAELAAIHNVIGDYICKLCRLKFDDAFGLARHRCACIVLLEYRCPECRKQFNCPANLASHRRWHKPKKEMKPNANRMSNTNEEDIRKENHEFRSNIDCKSVSQTSIANAAYTCHECGKQFKRQAYLRKHRATHDQFKSDPPVKKQKIEVKRLRSEMIHHQFKYDGNNRGQQHTYDQDQEQEQDQDQDQHEEQQEEEVSSSVDGKSNSTSVLSGYSITMELNHDDELYADTPGECDDSEERLPDSASECSSSASSGYGRLKIVDGSLTEEESIAAAALTKLRNCASVIQHTTLAHCF